MLKKLILSILFSIPLLSFAGGFQINLQGQKQTGMGHTGVGLLSDASTVLFNPGAMSFLDSNYRISVGMNLLFPRVTYQELMPGNYTAETVHNIGTPFTFYGTWKLKNLEKLSIGLGIYTPFGSKMQWEDDWLGQFLIREIDLKTIFFQPTVSYKLSDDFGIGLGLIYATGSFGLRKGVPVQDVNLEYGEGVLNGKASGYGFNAGMYFKASDNLTFGFDYRSAVKTSINNGTASFTVPSSLSEYFPSTTFNTNIKLPSVLTLGIGYSLKKFKFALDINQVGWKSYDSLVIDFADNTDKLADIHSARKYKDSFIIRIGAEYVLNKTLTFRMGSYFDKTPVQDGYLTPETPDVNKIGITAGLSLRPTKFMSIDFSFLFIEGQRRTDTNLETDFGGTYKSRALVPGIGFEFIF